MGVHAPPGFLLRDDLGAARHETHAGVVVVCEDRFDEVVGEVEGADGIAFGVPYENVGGGKVGGEVELLSVGVVRQHDCLRGNGEVFTCKSRVRDRRAIKRCRAFL